MTPAEAVVDPIALSAWDLAIASSLVGINGLLSLWLGLNLGRKLLVASVRTLVQLVALGFVLTWVFEAANAPVVIAMAVAMIVLAAGAATKRASRTYAGARMASFAALMVGAGVTLSAATFGILGPEPWWEPRYLIPLLGMILGNSLTGVSLGLDRTLSELDTNRDRVEALLSFGATSWEAARPIAREALRTGMIPILNTMTVVGLVTIPGMMTGQILSGTPPMEAARYQILIMFLIAAATAMGTTLSVLLSVRALFDDEHRLRAERIRER